MTKSEKDRIYHIERKVDLILELLRSSPLIFPHPGFPSEPETKVLHEAALGNLITHYASI